METLRQLIYWRSTPPPLLDAFYASDPPLPTETYYPDDSEDPPERNARILTTADYDELLRRLFGAELMGEPDHVYGIRVERGSTSGPDWLGTC
jgi:hypothetical protein